MDIGGTNIRCEIFDSDGKLTASEFMSTQSTGLIKAIEKIAEQYNVEKIGISYAGQVNDGVILAAPNIKVDEPNIQEYFLRKHNIELYIENDLKCAALAEYKYWACSTTMVAASIGTGFGSAIMDKGKLLRGWHNLAGEVGHIPYKYSEIPCGCGNHYCIEAFCSGSALSRWIEYYHLPIKEHTIENLRNLKRPEADRILENFHDAFLFAIGTIISLLNPEKIILGGGVIHKNPYLLHLLKKNVHKYALSKSLEQVEILLSELKDAPLEGAKILLNAGEN